MKRQKALRVEETHLESHFLKNHTTRMLTNVLKSEESDEERPSCCTSSRRNQNVLIDLNEGIFYSWECISLIRSNGTTLDLVIPDQSHLMALIHFTHMHVDKPEEKLGEKMKNFLSVYKKLKFKMKLSYESWNRRITLGQLIQNAVFKTLVQIYRITGFQLQKFLKSDFNE